MGETLMCEMWRGRRQEKRDGREGKGIERRNDEIKCGEMLLTIDREGVMRLLTRTMDVVWIDAKLTVRMRSTRDLMVFSSP